MRLKLIFKIALSLFVALNLMAADKSLKGQENLPDEVQAAGAQTPVPKQLAKKVPDDKKAEVAADAIARMKEILQKVLLHLEDARKERDMVKLNCVNERLSTIKGLLKAAETALPLMNQSMSKGDSERADHKMNTISIARQKCEALLAESETCIGDSAVYSGNTNVQLEITGIYDEDTTQTDDIRNDERNPSASPYQ